MPEVFVGVSLGSNLGNRNAELQAGIDFLRSLAEDGKIRESPRFETAPIDCAPGTPPFLNSVAEIKLDSILIAPLNLLRGLQEFEIERGRAPFHERNSPRPLDLDIIYYGTGPFDALGLVIPHPRAHLRRFVLQPLAVLRPDLILPGQTRTVRELWVEMQKLESRSSARP
jgi:2-amino-4-hydroxy-6-hydroxymethyldihydropteridine diphosphokinase